MDLKSYGLVLGAFFNYAIVLAVILLVGYRVWKRIYSFSELVSTFGHHLLAFLEMALTGVVKVAAMISLDLIICLYSISEMVFPLYILLMIITGCCVHSYISHKKQWLS